MQMNMLSQAGFGVADMASALGKSEAQLRADLEAGKIGFNELTKAMQVATSEGGKFYGSAERHANTLAGRIKILQDLIASTGDAIGTKVLPEMVGLLKYITDISKAGQEKFVNTFAGAIKTVIHWIHQIMILFEVLGYRIEDAGLSFAPVKQLAGDFFAFLESAFTGLFPFILEIGKILLAAFKPIQAFVSPILKELGETIRGVFSTLARLLKPITPMVRDSAGFFGILGQAISGILGPALIVAGAIKGITLGIAGFKAVTGAINAVSTSFKVLSGTMSVMKAASEGNRVALLLLDLQMLKTKITTFAMAAAQKIQAAASVIAANAQAILNAIMAANPIGLIIMAVIALIAIIILLVKNWDKVGPAIKRAFSAIGNFFKSLWEGIKSFFAKITAFVKKNLVNIINIIVTILFPIAGIVMALVRLVIKHWDKIKPALIKIFTVVVDKLKAIWGKIVGIVRDIIDGIKAGWTAFVGFITGLWEGIKEAAASIWEGVKNIFFGVVDGIKNIWNGLVSFFTGLWDAIMQGPEAVVQYIKDAFFGLFDTIGEKFFGFINKIKEGWEKVKGFFSGLVEGAVNFVTGGNEQNEGGEGSLAYATVPAATAASQSRVGGTSNYAYNSGGNSTTTINSNGAITVNVPAGTSADQAAAISRQVDAQVASSLQSAINGSRGNIPSPEVRRH
jgi:phage-related protein